MSANNQICSLLPFSIGNVSIYMKDVKVLRFNRKVRPFWITIECNSVGWQHLANEIDKVLFSLHDSNHVFMVDDSLCRVIIAPALEHHLLDGIFPCIDLSVNIMITRHNKKPFYWNSDSKTYIFQIRCHVISKTFVTRSGSLYVTCTEYIVTLEPLFNEEPYQFVSQLVGREVRTTQMKV